MYKLSLHEKARGWRLILHFKEGTKSIDFPTLETALKNLNRAIEIREMSKKEMLKWVRQQEIKS